MNKETIENRKSQIQNKVVRVFIAIELPLSIRESALRHIQILRQSFPRVRASWERIEKMHITLKFLGEIDEKQLANLQKAIEATTQEFQSFEISIEKTGAFPPRGVPRVLWLGVNDKAENLMRLHSKLEDECARIGFKKEKRAFHPHTTLARIRETNNDTKKMSVQHEELDFQSEHFVVNSLVLIKSELLPTGSRYQTLSIHKLRALE